MGLKIATLVCTLFIAGYAQAQTAVRYGSGTTFFQQSISTPTVFCDNSVFGDPTPGVAKHCDTFNSITSVWTFCANEATTCTIPAVTSVSGPVVNAGYSVAWGQPENVVNATLWLKSPGAADFVSIGTFD